MVVDSAALKSLPYLVWRSYVDNLVNYAPESWVASTARTFRILAIVMVVPFALLTLLDVTSYVIARTLGVIDDTQAATSYLEKPELAATSTSASNPTILVSDVSRGANLTSDMPTPSSSSFAVAHEHEDRLHAAAEHHHHLAPSDRTAPTHWFTGGSDQLSGVGVFSPVASRPGSPAIERRTFLEDSTSRKRAGSGSWQSSLSSLGGAFTPLESDEGDGEAGTHLRQRKAAGPTGAWTE